MNSTNQKVPELKCYQWLCDLSFLSDIMSHLNDLNLHLQDTDKISRVFMIKRKHFTENSNSFYLALLEMTTFIKVDISSYRTCKKLQYPSTFRTAIQLFFIRTTSNNERRVRQRK